MPLRGAAARIAEISMGQRGTRYEPGQEIDVQVRMAKELDLLPAKAPADRPYQALILPPCCRTARKKRWAR